LVVYQETRKKKNSEHMHSAISTASHFNNYMINIIGSHNLSYYHIIAYSPDPSFHLYDSLFYCRNTLLEDWPLLRR